MSFLDEESPREAQPRFLDLSAMKINSREELQSVLCKILEMRLRSDKLNDDDLQNILLCNLSGTPLAKYAFLDPVPASMKDVDLKELIQVDIDWKMLTLARPDTKKETEIFTRIVELNKLTWKSVIYEKTHVPNKKEILERIAAEDNMVQEPNADEFTYDFFSRRLGTDDQPPPAEDTTKKSIDITKPKPKLDPIVTEIPTIIPPRDLSTSLQLKGKKKKGKTKKKSTKRRGFKRIFKRLKSGKIVYKIFRRKQRRYVIRRNGKKIKLKTAKPKAIVHKPETKASSSPTLTEIHDRQDGKEKTVLGWKNESEKLVDTMSSPRKIATSISAKGSFTKLVKNQRGLKKITNTSSKIKKLGDSNLEKIAAKRKVKVSKRISNMTLVSKTNHAVVVKNLVPGKQINSDDKATEKNENSKGQKIVETNKKS